MSDNKADFKQPIEDAKRPLNHVERAEIANSPVETSVQGAAATGATPLQDNKRSSFLGRALSKQNKETAKKFFSAYAQTWVGLSPLWLMGEALTPGTKVGRQFKKGKNNLIIVAEEIRMAVSTNSQDIVIIVDEKLRSGKIETGKTAEVLKAAGDNAILVVSSSLERAQEQLRQLNVEYGPKIRRSVKSNGRDVIVVIDKALKNPIVVTGVSKFAKTQGIPHADALLRLASLALAKILTTLPEENLQGVESIVEELDASELERTSSSEERESASKIGHQLGDGPAPQMTEPRQADPYEKMKKDTSCVIN